MDEQQRQEMEKRIALKREETETKFRRKAVKLGYDVREYSGRGMYGRVCPGVNVDNPDDFIAEMGMTGLHVDNMGKGYIVYTG